MYAPSNDQEARLFLETLDQYGQVFAASRANGLSRRPAPNNPDVLKNIEALDKSRVRSAKWYQDSVGRVEEAVDRAPNLTLGSERAEATYWLKIFKDHGTLLYTALPPGELKDRAFHEVIKRARWMAVTFGLLYPGTEIEDVDAPVEVEDAPILPDPRDVLYDAWPNDNADVANYGKGSQAQLALQYLNDNLQELLRDVYNRASLEFVGFGLYKSFLAEMMWESDYFVIKVLDRAPMLVQHEVRYWSEHAKDHSLLFRQLLDPQDDEEIARVQADADIGTLLSTRNGIQGVCAAVDDAPHDCVLPFGALTYALQQTTANDAVGIYEKLPQHNFGSKEEIQGPVPPLLASHTALESQYGAAVFQRVYGRKKIKNVFRDGAFDPAQASVLDYAKLLQQVHSR